jgi:pilus assembly protein CpaB
MATASGVKFGDHVDILATYHDPRTNQQLTKMILQNVLVLAVNKRSPGPSPKSVTENFIVLAATREQGELLSAADRAGALRIQLRPLRDETVVPSLGVTTRDFGASRVHEETAVASSGTPVNITIPSSRSRPGAGDFWLRGEFQKLLEERKQERRENRE